VAKFPIARVAAASLAAWLAGCASEPQVKPQAAPPPVAASDSLETEAMAFESFVRHARAIDPDFSSAAEVRQALQAGAAHEPQQFEAGMVAYAALAALQEPAFIRGVQRQAKGADLARRLAADPQLALGLPGGASAAGRAGAALARQGQGLADNGARVKRAAYSVQHQAWSKTSVANPAGRLAEVKRISAVRRRPEPGDAAGLRAALADGGRGGGGASPLVSRAVALAALSVMGQEGKGQALLREPKSSACLRLAKLNLYQCLASSGPQYEDIYCLGQHALIEPGQCVSAAARDLPGTRLSAAAGSYER
jgi:hypothetical protein